MGTRRRGLAIGAGLILAGCVLGTGCSDDEATGPTTTSTTAAPMTTPPPSSPPTTLPAEAVEVIATTVAANNALVAGGSLWVAGTEDPDKTGGDTLLRLDLATGQVTSRLDVDGFPLGLVDIGDLLWIRTSTGLARVDMVSEEVDTVDLGGQGRAMAASEETVWLEVRQDGKLDPDITVVDVSSLEARTFAVSDAASAVVLDMESDGETLWVAFDDGRRKGVRAFDAATDQPVAGFDDPWPDDGTQALELELVGGELWACGRSLACLVVDPATGEVIREVSIDHPGGELSDLVFGEGSLWAAIGVQPDDPEEGSDFDGKTSAFLRVDPANGAVLGLLYEAAYPVPSLAVGDGAAFLVASANESRFDRELVRIDLG